MNEADDKMKARLAMLFASVFIIFSRLDTTYGLAVGLAVMIISLAASAYFWFRPKR